jgi:carboxypeptidase Taq
VDESQSRLWERNVGSSLPFARVLHGILLDEGVHVPRGMTPERLYLEMNRVQPSYIRTQADEVTYNLHVILRYEIEKRLIEGSLEVTGVPEAWNQGMQELLGLTVENDAHGALQDVHWSSGLFGYFPTYALGNVYAANIFAAIERDTPDLAERMTKGDFSPILAWTRERIHAKGQGLPPRILLRRATGSKDPSVPNEFFFYLKRKYGDLYGV